MMQTIFNNEGEPIGTEYIRCQFEEEEAEWEENMRCAEDPMYAAQKEERRWYNEACAAFEERGIQVPEDVINALSRELRLKEQYRQEKKALAEVKPVVDFLNGLFPNSKATAHYYPETCDEISYTEIHFDGVRPTRTEIEYAIKIGLEKDIYIEDYIGSLRYFK